MGRRYNKPIAEILLIPVDVIRTSGVEPFGDNDGSWHWGGKSV